MTTTQDLGTHTGCYRDVTAVPADALAAVAGFVAREWGDGYRMGYVGSTNHETDGHVYVFQVKAGDGSRFAVGATRYGEAVELTGRLWLLFLQRHEVEATVRGVS